MTLWMLLLWGCANDPGARAPAPPTEVEAPPQAGDDADAEALEKTRNAAMKLGSTLKARLVATLQQDGPLKALNICADEAQGMTAMVRGETGVTVGRLGTRTRNPANRAPAWAQQWLADANAAGQSSWEPSVSIRERDGRRMATFAAPIVVAEPCLACHGQPKEAVAAALAQRYPDDQATGYRAGDLRGVLWAELDIGALSQEP